MPDGPRQARGKKRTLVNETRVELDAFGTGVKQCLGRGGIIDPATAYDRKLTTHLTADRRHAPHGNFAERLAAQVIIIEAEPPNCRERIGRDDISVLHSPNGQLLQDLIAQTMLTSPSSLRYCLRHLLRMKEGNHQLNLELLGKTLNKIILSHAPLYNSSEVAWAIWAAMAFNLKIDRQMTALAMKMEDSVVALLAMDADANRKVMTKFDSSCWVVRCGTDQLYESHWPMAYEFYCKSWHPSTAGKYVKNDPCFQFLHKNRVAFYMLFATAKPADISGPDLADYPGPIFSFTGNPTPAT